VKIYMPLTSCWPKTKEKTKTLKQILILDSAYFGRYYFLDMEF
jgi:hypothetical protein